METWMNLMDGWMDGWLVRKRWMDGRKKEKEEKKDGWMDGRVDE